MPGRVLHGLSMTIVTTVATVSHKYYAKRSKMEIIRRIEELRRALGIDTYHPDERKWLMTQTNSELAFIALDHHAKFPE